MFDKYLVTGATGFLGRVVAEELVRRKAQVHALVMTPIPICSRRRYAPSLVMCAIKAHCQTSSRMPTAVPV